MSERVLGVIGTGLIGASIGLRARREGWLVLGYDLDIAASQLALEGEAIDAVATHDEILARSDVIAIAVPPHATVGEVFRLRDAVGVKAELIFDVASVKAAVVFAGADVKNFVASHPMAGRERSGPQAADVGLFYERAWAYVASGDLALDDRFRAFVADLGARAFAIEPGLHDRTVALTSHLPQLMAFAFVDRLLGVQPEAREGLSGPVARELRRIGVSDRALWREIFALNSGDLASEARSLADTLNAAADKLDAGEFLP